MKGPLVDWGVSETALAGNECNGDGYIARQFGHRFLIAVVDGLGHGKEAAEASFIAVNALNNIVSPEDPVALVKQCHQALKGSRGVVLSMAVFDAGAGSMTWLGIGNVEGVLMRGNGTKETLFLFQGILGYNLPSVRPWTIPVSEGDTVVLATDGVRRGFSEDINPFDPPVRIARMIMEKHIRKTDDALVLAARYLGVRQDDV